MFKELERIGKDRHMEYQRLGDYIREVNVRNRELKVTTLLGLSIEKKFIPSIANWKKAFLSKASLVFTQEAPEKAKDKEIQGLYAKIGQLEISPYSTGNTRTCCAA